MLLKILAELFKSCICGMIFKIYFYKTNVFDLGKISPEIYYNSLKYSGESLQFKHVPISLKSAALHTFFRLYICFEIDQQYKAKNTLIWSSMESSVYYPPKIFQNMFFFFIFVAIKTAFFECSYHIAVYEKM